MEDIGSLIIYLAIIYIAIIIFTILLLNKLYKVELVLGTKTKEVTRCGSFDYSTGDSSVHVTSDFSFKTKDGKNRSIQTSFFPMTKKGKKRYFFYNKDKNEIVGQRHTVVWQSLLLMLNIFYSLAAGTLFFIIAILIIILVIILYANNYAKNINS